jgi:hypothetical protein
LAINLCGEYIIVVNIAHRTKEITLIILVCSATGLVLFYDVISRREFSFGKMKILTLLIALVFIFLGFIFRRSQKIESLLMIFFLLLIFGYLKFIYFRNFDDLSVWPDTKSYVEVASNFGNQDFWTSKRPFVLPFIYKLLNVNLGNYKQQNSLQRIALFQVIFSSISWTFLALSVFSLIKNESLKIPAFVVIMLLSVGLDISMWERLILSESISNSLFILIISFALLFTEFKTRHINQKNILVMALMVFTLVLYIFIRDSNSLIILLGGVVSIPILLLRKNRCSLTIAGVCIAGFAILLSIFSLYQVSISTRTNEPIAHLFADRISKNSEYTQYFSQKGIDVSLIGKYKPWESSTLKKEDFKKAKSAYAQFMISHPEYVFEPFKKIKGILSPTNIDYLHRIPSQTSLERVLSNFIYPKGIWIYYLTIIFCVIPLLIRPREYNSKMELLLFMIISVLPIGLIVWYSDSIEITRHAEQILLQSRLAFWLSIIFLLDLLLSLIKGRSKSMKVKKIVE